MRLAFEKEWKAEWRGHTIRFLNVWDLLLRTSEYLYIDGTSVPYERRGNLFWGSLRANLHEDGGKHCVEVKAGPKNLGLGIGCSIFVDGEWVGGDAPRSVGAWPL